MQQTTVRALTELEPAAALAVRMAAAVRDRRDTTTDMLGELATDVELTRNAPVAGEQRCRDDERLRLLIDRYLGTAVSGPAANGPASAPARATGCSPTARAARRRVDRGIIRGDPQPRGHLVVDGMLQAQP